MNLKSATVSRLKAQFAAALLVLLSACGSGGPPPPDWKADAADLIERYKKHELLGENILAERYFQQAIAATGGAGRVADTARLWLVRCATRKTSLADDDCHEYAELARIDTTAEDRAYYQFITLRWSEVDATKLPKQYAGLMQAEAGKINPQISSIDDPLSRLLATSLMTMRKQANDATLSIAAETASSQGWRRPLLVYLKLQEKQAFGRGDSVEQARLKVRIQLVEDAYSGPH